MALPVEQRRLLHDAVAEIIQLIPSARRAQTNHQLGIINALVPLDKRRFERPVAANVAVSNAFKRRRENELFTVTNNHSKKQITVRGVETLASLLSLAVSTVRVRFSSGGGSFVVTRPDFPHGLRVDRPKLFQDGPEIDPPPRLEDLMDAARDAA
jgi:hypothetical protein